MGDQRVIVADNSVTPDGINPGARITPANMRHLVTGGADGRKKFLAGDFRITQNAETHVVNPFAGAVPRDPCAAELYYPVILGHNGRGDKAAFRVSRRRRLCHDRRQENCLIGIPTVLDIPSLLKRIPRDSLAVIIMLTALCLAALGGALMKILTESLSPPLVSWFRFAAYGLLLVPIACGAPGRDVSGRQGHWSRSGAA